MQSVAQVAKQASDGGESTSVWHDAHRLTICAYGLLLLLQVGYKGLLVVEETAGSYDGGCENITGEQTLLIAHMRVKRVVARLACTLWLRSCLLPLASSHS